MKIVIIIPTYNEKSSIGAVIDALENEFKSITGHQMEILVVDGRSTDGTDKIVEEKANEYKNVYLLSEKEKRGLGVAYVFGMKYAISNLKADAFMEFDGDFQHDPKDIKKLIYELDNGYDYIIGSRYVLGGEIPKAWAFYRKLLSWFGSFTIRFVLNLGVNDGTSGFKLSRVKGLAEHLSLNENKLLSKRYAYKIQFLYEMIKAGAKTKEVAIKFLEREKEYSKSSFEDVFESLKVIFRLKLRSIFGKHE